MRTLNVLDDYCREALGIEIDYSLPARRVTRLRDRLVEERGKPQRLRSDNGPEFSSEELQNWCKVNEVELHSMSQVSQHKMLTSSDLMEHFDRRY